MSDGPCNADEELGKLHSRELDRQLNAEYSAMLDRQRHNDWPPECKCLCLRCRCEQPCEVRTDGEIIQWFCKECFTLCDVEVVFDDE